MTIASERAVLAGGCFWGMQDLIRRYPGVISTRVGYTGGDVRNANYRNRGSHAEAIEIVFDPTRISTEMSLQGARLQYEAHDQHSRRQIADEGHHHLTTLTCRRAPSLHAQNSGRHRQSCNRVSTRPRSVFAMRPLQSFAGQQSSGNLFCSLGCGVLTRVRKSLMLRSRIDV
jgi:peptide methionine sulfoxide reductase MsrA